MAFTRKDIEKFLHELNRELGQMDVFGELYLVGGAVMSLVFDARSSTKDIDGYFKPTTAIRIAASRVALANDLPDDWLNDAVKGFLSPRSDFDSFCSLSNLKVFVASPQYLLAMKCLALRIGEEFHDLDDVRYLLRYLNINKYQKAIDIINMYYPAEKIPQKTLYALEELLG